MEKLRLPSPSLSEQRKIATVLYTVDRTIEKTEDTIECLNRIQKGTLRDLFENGIKKEVETQDSPMGRFPKHWELKPMKKVGSLINGSAFPKEYQGLPDGKHPFIKVSDTNNYRRFVTGAKNYITEEIAEEMGCNIHPEGTVILPKRGAAIMTNKRRILAQDSAIDNNQIGIVGEEVEPLFLYYYLSDVNMGRFVQEGAVKSLTKSLLSNIRVPVPSAETQSRIVKTLESIDERIEAEKQVKNQQERLKRGLMQDLLSGTVRTTDTNIEVPEEIVQYG
jgi:type I restriction enzyme S subunit